MTFGSFDAALRIGGHRGGRQGHCPQFLSFRELKWTISHRFIAVEERSAKKMQINRLLELAIVELS
jgi:hypothetical protein